MSKTSEQLIEEIHEYIIKDRQRLEQVSESLLRAAETDPLAAAEPFAKVADVLNKSTAQLVEIVKAKLRSETKGGSDVEFSEEEADVIMDEIEGDLLDPPDDAN